MRSKSLAAALIALMLLGSSGSWHVEGDDPDFLPQLAGHDHSTHNEVFRTTATDPGPVHCAICHWLQMFRASAMRHARVQFSTPPERAGILSVVAPVRAGSLLDVPSRAPPA